MWITTGVIVRDTGAAFSQVRRTIDKLASEDKIRTMRGGQYRLVWSEDIGIVRDALQAKGWLRQSQPQPAA